MRQLDMERAPQNIPTTYALHQMAFITESTYPTWTKNLNLDSQLRFDNFPLAKYFKHVANIISTPADSKRQTVITFDPVVSTEEWNEKRD